MNASLVLGPVLDVLAPADRAAAGRRVRNAALFLALAAWLLPTYPPLGTDTTAHRAAICAAFAAAAVAAQFRHAHRWARVALPVAACAAAALIAWFGRGAGWGLLFVVYAVLVATATDVRLRRFPPALPVEDADPLPPRPRFPTRLLNWYAWFCISALVVTQWTMQFMFVPTGSMQPAIMGARLTGTGEKHMGDALLVDKTRYLVRDPRRWEIVVFRFPLFPERNFVKRLVGLPGEHVEIKDGDVWIDGAVARKPPLVQETMWQEVFPRQVTSNSFGAPKSVQQAWLQSGGGGDWKPLGPDEVRGKLEKGGPSWLACTRKIEGRDARLSFDVALESPSYVAARITSRGVPVELALPTGDSTMSEFSAGASKAPGVMDALGHSGKALRHVELTVLDGETWWSLDGAEKERLPLPAAVRGDTRVEIGVSGEATFSNLRVESDIVYKPGELGSAWDVPNDGFFFLGDNVVGSDDSRRWSALVFHPKDGGPAITAAAQVPDELGRMKDQIRIDGNVKLFVDVDGVPRAVPRDTPYESVPYPFARRGHIVGRAVMIVFPWTVAEAGFRPRFLP